MLLVLARVTVKPGKRDEFIAAAQPSIAGTRKEKGNRLYQLYASTHNDVDLIYCEEWDSEEDLAAHLQSPHMKAFWDYQKDHDLMAEDGKDVRKYTV